MAPRERRAARAGGSPVRSGTAAPATTALVIVLLLSAGASTPAAASARHGEVVNTVDALASPFGIYLAPAASLGLRSGRLAVGAGIRMVAALDRFELLVAPFARVDQGAVHLRAGLAFGPVLSTQSPGEAAPRLVTTGLLIGLGLAPVAVPVARGTLRGAVGLEHLVAIPQPADPVPADRLVSSWYLPPMPSAVLEWLLRSTLLTVGVSYAVPLPPRADR